MVLLTVHLNTNPMMVPFSEPLFGVRRLRLVSALMHNTPRTIDVKTLSGGWQYVITKGYMTTDELLGLSIFSSNLVEKTSPDPDTGRAYKVKLMDGTTIPPPPSLQKLLWLPTNQAPAESSFNKLNTLDVYFVHCDMVDDRQCLLNNQKAPVVGIIPLKEGAPKREVYPASEKQPWVQAKERPSWYHIKIAIKDIDGAVVDLSPNYVTMVLEIA